MTPASRQPQAHRVVVREVNEEARNVRGLVLELPDGAKVDFEPGQFIRLRFPTEREWRDYSLCSPPPASGRFRICLARAGRFTERLFELKPGDELSAEGPMGAWHFRDEGRPVVLVSGGTGVTPFRSIIEHLLGKGLPRPVSLFYSARTPADILFRDDLASYPSRGVPVLVTVTRPQELAPGEHWDGPVGRLTASLIRERTPAFGESAFYLCGPARLVTSLRDALLALEVPRERLHYDAWVEGAGA